MERRRISPLDEYIISIQEPPEDADKKTQFYNSLRHFYRKKWGCPLKVPFIHGVELDLYKLYDAVISYGGYQKVSNAERWSDILKEMSIDENVQVADHGIKSIYMRYLSKYEQTEFGRDNDDHEQELMMSSRSSRLKGLTLLAYTESPVPMPKHSSLNEHSTPQYVKIARSLLSGLPNEIDFSMNICTLLSHPGPYLLKFSDCPQLISILVAHCCVFDDDDFGLMEVFCDYWKLHPKMDYNAFWSNAGVEDEDVLALLPDFLDAVKALNRGEIDETIVASTSSCFKTALCRRNDGDGTFDMRNVTNWRVFQVLSILRNLSFEDCNKLPMARNTALLKFLIICCYSDCQPLITNAFDTLSNIASEIDLSGDSSVFRTHLLLKLVSRGLFSADKFQVLRALEIFTGLCCTKSNESLIVEFCDERLLSRLFALITVKDILLCLSTLESLYQASEMGRPLCEVISSHRRSIDILVDLATTEAASFSGSGLKGIKVFGINEATGQLQQIFNSQRSTSSTNVYKYGASNTGGGTTAMTTVANVPLSSASYSAAGSGVRTSATLKHTYPHITPKLEYSGVNTGLPTHHHASSVAAYHHFQSATAAPPSPLYLQSTGALSATRPQFSVSSTTSVNNVIYATSNGGIQSIGTGSTAAVYSANSAAAALSQPQLSSPGSNIYTRSAKTPRQQQQTKITPNTPVSAVIRQQRGGGTIASSSRSRFAATGRGGGSSIRNGGRGNARKFSSVLSTSLRNGAPSPPTPQAVHDVVAAIAGSSAANLRAPLSVLTTTSSSVAAGPPSCSVSTIAGSTTGGSGEGKLEQITRSWIRDHCVYETGALASRGDMYACYVEYVRKQHNILSCSLQTFISHLKACFPSITITHSPGSSIHAVEGLRFVKEGNCNSDNRSDPSSIILSTSATNASQPCSGETNATTSKVNNAGASSTATVESLKCTVTAVNDKSTVNASLTSNKCNNNSEDNGGGGELKNLKTTVVDIDNGVSSSNNNNNDASKVEGGVNEKQTLKTSDAGPMMTDTMSTAAQKDFSIQQNGVMTPNNNNKNEDDDGKKVESTTTKIVLPAKEGVTGGRFHLISDYKGGTLLCNGNTGKEQAETAAEGGALLNGFRQAPTHLEVSEANGGTIVGEKSTDKNGVETKNGNLSADGQADVGAEAMTVIAGSVDSVCVKRETGEVNRSDGATAEENHLTNGVLCHSKLAFTPKGRKRTITANGMSRGTSGAAKRGKMAATRLSNGNAVVSGGISYGESSTTASNGYSRTYDPTSLPSTSTAASTTSQQPVVVAGAAPSFVEFICEWDSCGRVFGTSSAMLFHNTNDHVKKDCAAAGDRPIFCKWPACDVIPRSKWSMVSHLQDNHCVDFVLQNALRRRMDMGVAEYLALMRQRVDEQKRRIAAAEMPPAASSSQSVAATAGYSKFAAVEAIKRNAFLYMPKDITDESEGPVTRSLRLTSCLVLRNIARYSVEGRRKLRKYEAHLSWMALSKMESSGALAQCLAELAAHSALAAGVSAGGASATIAASASSNSLADESTNGQEEK